VAASAFRARGVRQRHGPDVHVALRKGNLDACFAQFALDGDVQVQRKRRGR